MTEDRSLIVTWANRGTLHLITAEDEPLLHGLTTPQLRTTSQRRLSQEGVSPGMAERGIRTLVRALGDSGPMTRDQIRGVLDQSGVRTAGQALVHVLFRATLDGLIVRGPMVNGEQAFVLAADWLGKRPKFDHGRALAELARRYLRGHGPADERDLARWAQITIRDARAGLAAIGAELTQWPDGLVDVPGRDPAPLPRPRLLGPFDPLLLGWRSRGFVLGDRTNVVMTNGIVRPIALVRGRAAGTWTMPQGQVSLELWKEEPRSVTAALEREAAAVQGYLKRP